MILLNIFSVMSLLFDFICIKNKDIIQSITQLRITILAKLKDSILNLILLKILLKKIMYLSW